MDERQTTVAAIREVIFQNAASLNQRLLERFGTVADHMSRQEERAVIGALDGAEADIAKMRNLMLILRDCFAVRRDEGGRHS